MSFVIVEHVYDPDAAARELAERGDDKRASEVRERGQGTFIAPGLARLSSDRRTAEVALAKHAYALNIEGVQYHLRTDYDPDWSKQNFAIEEAVREVPALRERSAVKAVNVFNRAYYGRDARWDITDHGGGRWPQVDARNFADAAYLVANALAGLRLVDGAAAQPHVLDPAARLGWDLTEVQDGTFVSAGLWLAFALGRTLRQCGEGDLDRLAEAIEAGSRGNS